MSILEAELSICHRIQFDNIVLWNIRTFLCDNLLMVESNGTTNPESILENNH
jgi:hypothetical protein